MGSIYQRGNIYWIKYYRAGKPYFESSHSEKPSDAKRLLQSREGQIVENRFPGLKVMKIRFEDLAEDFLNDYKANDKKSLDRAELSVKHLKGYFEGMKAIDISTDKVKAYIIRRQEEGAENGTINRELTALKRMFNLAREMTPPKVSNVPFIPHLEEGPARQGYFEHNEYFALRKALPAYLKPVVSMAYNTGMRKEEILGLQWDQVDLMEGKITLKAEDTKTKESRVIYLEGELLEVMNFQRALRDSKFPSCPWVFFNEEGQRIGEFRKTWKTALIQTGKGVIECLGCGHLLKVSPPENPPKEKKKTKPVCPNCQGKKFTWAGKIFHDFRRTAIRNMVRAGVPERVAMAISGHKTRSIFERYNIVDENDLKLASKRVKEYHLERAKFENGDNMVTVPAQEAQFDLGEQAVIH